LSSKAVENAFFIVVIAVAGIGVLGAVLALLTSRRNWESFGRDRLVMESELRSGGSRHSAPLSPAASAERDDEIRQMLRARNARHRRRGEPEVDVEAELARLTAAVPAIDDELRGEIRDLVVARNLRRARRGQPPLDVEAEVTREVARLGESSGRRK
jgi:hypothetical protein